MGTRYQSRLKAHVTNNNTTPLFGLVNAISRQSIADGGAAFPSPMQLVLFLIWKDDMDFKYIAEILGSVLCSFYWIYGGLNCAALHRATVNMWAITGFDRSSKPQCVPHSHRTTIPTLAIRVSQQRAVSPVLVEHRSGSQSLVRHTHTMSGCIR